MTATVRGGLCRALWLAAAGALVAGCASHMMNRELEHVAKDWSMVIRASQIIPVYPLTEDLQPGDLFLVQTPVDAQHKAYGEKGFLPLENLIRRVDPRGYGEFYRLSFDAGGEKAPLPRTWLVPASGEPWATAPGVSFPTYSFSVRSSGGFNLALPVQGVPIGLSLMGGDAAQGTITIAEARTYGVDTVSLHRDVVMWAIANREFLRQFVPTGDRQNYVRAVSRVFLTGRLNVSLQRSGQAAAGLSGGAPKPVDLVVPTTAEKPEAQTLEVYRKNVDSLNSMIAEALKKATTGSGERLLPGGTVKVAAASAGSISLVETFQRPLVIGYLGFDMAIGAGGVLGPPIPTHAVVTAAQVPAAARQMSLAKDAESELLTYFAVRSSAIRSKIEECRRAKGLGTLETSDFLQDERYAAERKACVSEIFGLGS